jgi:5'-phosphate synthase pdxT subunit
VKIGVLALQGDFNKHVRIVERIGSSPVLIRYPQELDNIEGLIIPGGESTTLTILMEKNSLYTPLVKFGESYPILGTCAGLIMLARKIADPRIKPLGLLDVTIARNMYGRQVNSFSQSILVKIDGGEITIPATFIRAPQIEEVGPTVEILAVCNNQIVAIRDRLLIGLAFHPEMDDVSIFHESLFSKSNKGKFQSPGSMTYAA